MVVMKNGLKEAPYDSRGNLLHYADDRPWAGRREDCDWRPNEPMELRLTIDGVTSGRSAKYVTWIAANGTRYPMFVSDIVEMFRDGITVTAGQVQGIFRVRKRGQNFGLCYEGPIPAGPPEATGGE